MKRTRKRDQQMPAEPEKREEQTQPLPNLAALAFEGFLARHQLSILDVALAAGVRLLTVWRVARDYPISLEQAQQVRLGLYQLTGVHYRGRILLQATYSEASPGPQAPRRAGKARQR